MSEPFVINVADTPATRYPGSGTFVTFEKDGERFPDLGIGIHMLDPGEASAMYHAETNQENFLVLAGECKVILNGEEHALKQWDFVHCPPGTAHVFVGAGDGPCWILMVGARKPDGTIHYPVDEAAAKYDASVTTATDDAREAYAAWTSEFEQTKLPWPPG